MNGTKIKINVSIKKLREGAHMSTSYGHAAIQNVFRKILRATLPALIAALTIDQSPAQSSAGEFKSVGDLSKPSDAEASILGGVRPAEPKDWSSIFYTKTNNGFCTGSLVGPRVLLTAAHCIDATKRIVLKRSTSDIEGNCDVAKEYANDLDQSADYALCLLKVPITDIKYERVNFKSGAISEGMTLLLSGFGCQNLADAHSGIFAIGDATVTAISDTNNLISTYGDASVCFGDSGGPAFLTSGSRDGKLRLLVSLNSSGDLTGTSYLASTSANGATRFFDEWKLAHADVHICSSTDKDNGCRAWNGK